MTQTSTRDKTGLPERRRGRDAGSAGLAQLEPANGRWTPSRKARIVIAVSLGQVDRSDALRCLKISEEELSTWERRYDAAGRRGLRSTRAREYL